MRCSIASTLDIIGDRWSILILRDLFIHQTRRFQDFESSLPGLTPSVLSARIKELAAHGILTEPALHRPSTATGIHADAQGARPEPDPRCHEGMG